VPIGRPLPGRRVYILDSAGGLVPRGVAGELYIGGDCLAEGHLNHAEGYLNHPEATASHFVPDPFAEDPQARMYRTGDRARFLPDGGLDFLGRLDDQLKVRGFRIEPGEIEAVLASCPGVRECAVVAHRGASESPQVVAHVALDPEAQPQPDAASLRARLARTLPAYMAPAHFVFHQSLPRTAGGKVNRRALASGPIAAAASREIAAPRNSIEFHLVQIWSQALGVSRLGIRDNFFDLGGHSLLSVRLMALIHQQFGVELPLSSLLVNATIESQAELLAGHVPSAVRSIIVPLRPQGGETPFFCVHALGGTLFSYLPLARHLNGGSPFYGIQSPALAGLPMLPSVEEMAAAYIQELLRVQPEGDYRLGGWSFGGVVAFEMARQLAARGQEVAALILMDSYHPAAVRALDDIDEAAFLANWNEQERHAIHQAQVASSAGPGALDLVDVYRINENALSLYHPGDYAGPMALLCASGQSSGAPAAASRGWESVVKGELIARPVPGHHYSMMWEPQAAALAAAIRSVLGSTQKTARHGAGSHG
jgi:thioesterase domain-containing protein/acyl carrier protein